MDRRDFIKGFGLAATATFIGLKNKPVECELIYQQRPDKNYSYQFYWSCKHPISGKVYDVAYIVDKVDIESSISKESSLKYISKSAEMAFKRVGIDVTIDVKEKDLILCQK